MAARCSRTEDGIRFSAPYDFIIFFI